MRTKIFAAYLPQYYVTEENNMFWGEGFTDWIGVKSAKPQFEGHVQPKVPLNDYYYDLSNAECVRWQAELARKYKIDGFCIYHYWFKGGKTVLDKPVRILLDNKDIDISFFFSWDNNSWIRSWSNITGNAWAPAFDKKSKNESEVLLEHEYGGKTEWKKHFDWLLPFFKDSRYYKIDGKPVFIVFGVDDKKTLDEIGEYWDALAKKAGFSGIYMITGVGPLRNKHCLDAQFRYQPSWIWGRREAITRRISKLFNLDGAAIRLRIYDYSWAWKKIINQTKRDLRKGIIVSGIVGFDDTPRRGERARIFKNSNPTAFYKYFRDFYRLNVKNKADFLLLTAWNEWGEGAYLEPDETFGFGFLESLKKVVDETEDTNECIEEYNKNRFN